MILKENMEWPPISGEVSRSLNEWDAWWTGNRGRLSAIYGGTTVRPGQLSGGIVGWGSRMLWGTPPRGSSDHRIHLPLASDIASASSDMLFGRELSIDWGEGNEVAGGRMETVLDEISWQSMLAEAGETAAALGGVFLRAGWDQDVADHPLMTVVAPDGALVDFSFGIPTAVTFWFTEAGDGNVVWRHTEQHEKGRIVHQLWKGSHNSLGTLQSLLEHPMTAGLAPSLDGEDYILTGTDALTAAYIPNMRPVPVWRRVPGAAYLGRSDFGVEGVIGLFDALDDTWTSWMRDIRLGRSRIFAASQMLQSDGPGQGAYVDLDREVYETLKIPFGDNPTVDSMISAQQFNIRVEEHARTIRELTLAAVSSCGYSGSTFGLDTEVEKTATEVGAVRGRTMSTRDKKTRYWVPQLERFLFALSELDRSIFGHTGFNDTRPRVSFPDSIAPTPIELAQTAQALRAAEAASTYTLVKLVNPDWDDDQVDEEVERINESNAAPAPVLVNDPFAAQDEPETPEPEE